MASGVAVRDESGVAQLSTFPSQLMNESFIYKLGVP